MYSHGKVTVRARGGASLALARVQAASLVIVTVSLYAAYDCVWRIRQWRIRLWWIRLRFFEIRLHYKCNNLDVLYNIATVTSRTSSYRQRSYHAER